MRQSQFCKYVLHFWRGVCDVTHNNSLDYFTVSTFPLFRRAIPTATLCLLLSTHVAASERLSFSGFGTLGYAATDSEDANYRTERALDGADDKGSFSVDSRLGVQADFLISDSSSAVVQLLAREGSNGDPEVFTEWAFLKKQLNDTFSVRAGRISLNTFMLSEFRETGFAQTLLRPPQELYVQTPLNSIDGVDVIANAELGETSLTVQAILGQRKEQFDADLTVDMKSIAGINVVAETDYWRWRVTYNQLDLAVYSQDILAASQSLAQLGVVYPQFAAVAKDLDGEHRSANFTGLGVEYEKGGLFLNAEFTRRKVNLFLPDTQGWYLAAGFRFGSFTPYAYVSQLHQTSKESVEFSDLPFLQEAATGVNDFYASADQRAIAAGLRWDFMPGFAFKAQVEQIELENYGVNFLRLGAPRRPEGDTVNLYSLTVDFIF